MASKSKLIASVIIFVFSIHSISADSALPLKTHEELEYADFSFQDFQVHGGSSQRLRKRQLNDLESEPTVSVNGNRLQFRAYGRDFDIYLKRESSLASANLDIEVRYESSLKPSRHLLADSFSDNYYVGFVQGEAKSMVICYFERRQSDQFASSGDEPAVFAQIQIEDEAKGTKTIYFIEPKQQSSSEEKRRHYIIYRSEDIASDLISNDRFNTSFCHPKFWNSSGTAAATAPGRQKRKADDERAADRQAGNRGAEAPNRCHLALVADHRFFKEIGNSNEKLTTAYLMNIVGSINVIFTQTPWILQAELDTELVSVNYGFSIDKIIIHAEPTAANQSKHYNSEAAIKNADDVLVLFGNEDWTPYCLAHLFTFQNFDGNVLGLAYVSSPHSYAIGGICSQRTTNPETRRPFSVNTGLSSYKSVSERQNRLLQREAELVTVHEFGHNWGSEHDPPKPECTPASGSGGGNYIMYAYANQGHERNNNFFSPCSIKSIGQVLYSKSTCFKPEPFSYCGNYRIEENEECDGGSVGLNDKDPCCDSKCRLRPGAVCSDSNHECCNKCQISAAGRICYSSPTYLDCFEDHSVCNGVSKECPVQKPKPQGTKCNSFDSGRCDAKGHCLSLCQQRDLLSTPCLCSKPDERCMVCCRAPPSPMDQLNMSSSSSAECIPYHLSFNMPNKEPTYQSNGRPCFNGLCENAVCKARVKDYVSRFWKVIQNVTVSAFVEFMKRNIVGSIILISLLIWVPISCCIHFCIDKRYRNQQRQQIQSMKERYFAAMRGKANEDSEGYLIPDNEEQEEYDDEEMLDARKYSRGEIVEVSSL